MQHNYNEMKQSLKMLRRMKEFIIICMFQYYSPLLHHVIFIDAVIKTAFKFAKWINNSNFVTSL